jgi:hypothetical protein
MNLKLEQAKGIIMWSDVILHLQQQPASTSQPPPKDEDQREPVTTRWIFDKINSHRLLDIPGLLANHVLAAQLLFVVARCKILDLFSRNVQLLNPDRVYEILDLFGWIDIRKLDIQKKRIVYHPNLNSTVFSLPSVPKDREHRRKEESDWVPVDRD